MAAPKRPAAMEVDYLAESEEKVLSGAKRGRTDEKTSQGGDAKRQKQAKKRDTVGVRQDLRVFFYPDPSDNEALQRRDLFILGFQRFASLPKEDINSYMQLASVHGRPMSVGYGIDAPPMEEDAYDQDPPNPLIKMKYADRSGDGVQFSNFGVGEFAYCKHGRPTFMTWHRPYIYLVERSIRECARYLIENRCIRGDLEAAKAQVDKLFLPYWNWGVEAPVPDILLCDVIELTQFSLDGQGASTISSDKSIKDGLPHRSLIPNPFKAFRPTDQQFQYFNGEVPTPDKYQAPQGVAGTLTDFASNCVFGPEGTLRQAGWSEYLFRFLVRDLRKNLAEAFFHKDFIAPDGAQDQSASHWFEAAHNALHNVFSITIASQHGLPPATAAPPKANMTGTRQLNNTAVLVGRSAMIGDMSTMDPAFWFHHCFVDCQVAMQRHAFPNGVYIPPKITPPVPPDPKKTYYPAEDPVPAVYDSNIPAGDPRRQWLVSSFHPWTRGLFVPDVYDGDTLSGERAKLRVDKTYQPDYVNSADVEDSKQWGYTYDILLSDPSAKQVNVKTSAKNSWLTPEAAQQNFIFDFTEDPFVKYVKEGISRFGKAVPWPSNQIPADFLAKLKASATNKMWKLNLKLPKFFKVVDEFGVGRSYTVNVFFRKDEDEKAGPQSWLPTDPSFAGSAAVFAPFNLRQCLNCQADNLYWPVFVDLTEVLIAQNATNLSIEDIASRLYVAPVGVEHLLPPAGTRVPEDLSKPEEYKLGDPPYPINRLPEHWKAEVAVTERPKPSGDDKSFGVVIYNWKESLRQSFQTRAARATEAKVSTERAMLRGPRSPSTAPSDIDVFNVVTQQDMLTNIQDLLEQRHFPVHEHKFNQPHRF